MEWRNKRVDRIDYSRLVKEVRASNTPSSRESMEFEYKYMLKNGLMKEEMNIIEKGGLMNGKERELRLLRFDKSPDGRETRLLLFNDDRTWNGSEMEMKERYEIKWSKGGQMIKHSRWKGCEGVGVKIKAERWWNCLKNNEMRWEIKRIERSEAGEDIRREGGETVEFKIWGRKEVEWRNKGVNRGDYSRVVKEVRPPNTPSSRDLMEFEYKSVLKKWSME